VIGSIGKRARLKFGHAANLALARPPRFVVVGTPRAGTSYVARYLTEIGVRCAHEGYFTPEGPRLRNRDRRFGSKGDSSWMAVPFATGHEMVVLHQVREPMAVIRSLVKIGLFDPRLRERYRRYVEFVERHFTPGAEAIDSAVRFYLEWNQRAEQYARLRYRLEDFETALPAMLETIGERPRHRRATMSIDFNTRPSAVGDDWSEGLDERVRLHPRFDEVVALGRRYGYSD
jgi:hypothetical protein